MPIYSYKCKKCAHAFDINQALSEDALTVCPECKGNLIKVFGLGDVTFKGSGFYKTDSASSSPKKSSGSES